MKNKILLLALVMFLFQGCIIHSLYPLYTDDTIITNENIEGFWSVETSNPTEDVECPSGMLFEKVENTDHYYMTICEDGVSSKFETHLVQIGKYTYLDMYPERDHPREKGKENKVGYSDIHLVPTHSFTRIKVSEKNLILESFKAEWLEKLFKQRKIRIKHEIVEDEILLTASSEDLQKFVKKYADEKEAFEDEEIFLKR